MKKVLLKKISAKKRRVYKRSDDNNDKADQKTENKNKEIEYISKQTPMTGLLSEKMRKKISLNEIKFFYFEESTGSKDWNEEEDRNIRNRFRQSKEKRKKKKSK